MSPFWKTFRLVFVIFFLYLLGDAFYRWDGFRYYGTLQDFIPSVALISVLWGLLAVLASILFSMVFHIVAIPARRISVEDGILFICVFIVIGAIAWKVKKIIWPLFAASAPIKIIIFLCVAIISLLVSFLLKKRTAYLVGKINGLITPLVWIFGLIFIVSLIIIIPQINLEDDVATSLTFRVTQDNDRPNIILITFDALTVENMSIYGYHRDTTPFIREWAKNAYLFERMEAASNYTAPTTASLMTGKNVWTHGRYHAHGLKPIKGGIENFPLLLKENGYYTMAFVANDLASVDRMGMELSFDINLSYNEFVLPRSLFGYIRKYLYNIFGHNIKMPFWILSVDFVLYGITPDFLKFPDVTEYPVELVFEKFFNIIESGSFREPFFAWIHLYPPHAYYLPPEEYQGMFDKSHKFRTQKEQYHFIRPRYFNDVDSAAILRARYDEFIKYCDSQFKAFIKRLEKTGLIDNTVIFLSSDHGESFEHGYLTHGGQFLFEEMTHIPLIIKYPRQEEGTVIKQVIGQIDIAPTILDFAGVTIPSWMEGQSLRPLLDNEGGLEPRPIFSMNFDKNRGKGHKIEKGTIAVWWDDYKLIHYLDDDRSLLFNLREDPDELHNLVDKEPVVARRLLNLIKDELRKANERIMGGE